MRDLDPESSFTTNYIGISHNTGNLIKSLSSFVSKLSPKNGYKAGRYITLVLLYVYNFSFKTGLGFKDIE